MNRPESAAAATTSAAADHTQPQQVRFRDPTMGAGWTAVPNVVLKHPHLAPAAKALYALILSYAWRQDRAWPGQARLAEDLGASERSIRSWLAELQAHGLLTITRRGRNLSNVYWLEPLTESPQDTVRQELPVGSANAAVPDRQHLPTNNTQAKKNSLNNMQPTATALPAPTSESSREQERLAARLASLGVTKRAATQLVTKYGAEACLRQCEWLPHRQARDPAAVLVKAIQEQWAAPAALEQGRAVPSRGSESPSSPADIFAAVADETGSAALAGMVARKQGMDQ